MNNIPDINKIMLTSGVAGMQGKGFNSYSEDYMFQIALSKAIREEFEKMPDEVFDGGNDKHFFVVMFRGTKLFVAENEIGGLTVMLPEEY